MNREIPFGLFCLALLAGPALLAWATGDRYLLILYVGVIFIFGL